MKYKRGKNPNSRNNLFQKGHKTNVGRVCSEETRRKIHLVNKGKFKGRHNSPSTEFKEGRIPIHKGKICWGEGGLWGKEHPMEGTHRTEETKNKIKISKLNSNYKVSDETKRKMSESMKGRIISEGWRAKISKTRKEKIKNGDKNIKLFGRDINPSFPLEKHYRWNNGSSFEPYGIEFNNKFKRAIRKRDNQICMLCDIHREKLSRALDVHHIDGGKKLSIPQNCVSLCRSCHVGTVHSNKNRKEHWIKFFQSLLNKNYNYKYTQEGEIKLNIGEQANGI